MIGMFTTLSFRKFPADYPLICLLVEFTFSSSEIGRDLDFTIIMIDPDGKRLIDQKGKMRIDRNKPNLAKLIEESKAIVIQMGNVKFEKAGEHAICLLIGNEERARIALRVDHVQSHPPADQT